MSKPTYIVEIKDLKGTVLVHDATTPAATFKGCLEAFHKFNDSGSFENVDHFVVEMVLRAEVGNKYEAGKLAFHFFKNHPEIQIMFKETK